jgi:hypothetical protein
MLPLDDTQVACDHSIVLILQARGKEMRFKSISWFTGLGIALAAFSSEPSFAVVLQTSNASVGNQAYSGVGLEFNVNAPISVTALGIYDSGQNGIAGSLTADILSLTGQVEATATFNSSGLYSQAGNYVFQNIAPLILSPGSYYLMGYGWSSNDPEHNSNIDGPADTFNTMGGAVSFVQAVWGGGSDSPGTLPNNTFGPTAPDFFSSANLMASAVPETSTWVMMLLGFVGVGVMAHRRNKNSQAFCFS